MLRSSHHSCTGFRNALDNHLSTDLGGVLLQTLVSTTLCLSAEFVEGPSTALGTSYRAKIVIGHDVQGSDVVR